MYDKQDKLSLFIYLYSTPQLFGVHLGTPLKNRFDCHFIYMKKLENKSKLKITLYISKILPPDINH